MKARSADREGETFPLSALNHFLFCPRRAALIHLEGIFIANVHTLRGDIVHEHSDLAGYEVAKGVLLWRALPVWSERLGLNGKCDIVEVRVKGSARVSRATEGVPPADLDSLLPVEFKLGKRRQWENDDVQLCAQALCLEEMFGLPVPRGAVFHANSKRRREVEFTPDLRARTEAAVAAVHSLFIEAATTDPGSAAGRLPPAVFKPACEGCSLFDVCLPRVTADADRAARLARSVFEV
jgi:CRISPR-associated exonuclease Cas4